MRKKIFNLDKLSRLIAKKKKQSKIIVHCHGVFDLLHIGHINHFNTCKSKGDVLVVTITCDQFVNKGPHRPAFNEKLRLEGLAALESVDYVAINYTSNAINAINAIKPNYYCKGADYAKSRDDLTGKILDEKKAVESVGGKLLITNDKMFSSSNLINKFSSFYSTDQKKFLDKIKKNYSFEDLKFNVEQLSKLKVLVIGETIIDKYVFCEALGKSGKESVLSFREFKSEKYLGGVLAIARHLSSFCKSISVLSFLGEKSEEFSFIKKSTEKNIKLNFIKKRNAKTIVKSRFVDQIDNRKLIGIYSVDDQSIERDQELIFIKKIKKEVKENDIVIISDYGHGIFTNNIVKEISKIKKYKSLNAQINSTNMGFHNIRKYSNIDSVIINASELRHEMRDKEGNLSKLGEKLKKDIKAKSLTITMGRAGAKLIGDKNKIDCPAFGTDTIDRVGAGDSMLSILSVCLFQKFESDISLLLASLAAAQSIKSIGNSKKVNKEELLKTLFHLMK